MIKKKYHFYAGHRNELLNDTCYNLHGHNYRLWVYVEAPKKDNGITFLFNDIDTIVEPVIKELDHSCLVHIKDKKLTQALDILETKRVVFNYPTSAENLAKYLFDSFKNDGLPIVRIDLMETESSTVIYEPR